MENKLRIVFAYCVGDPWAMSVSGELYQAADGLGHEMFVVGAQENPLVPRERYVDLRFIRSNATVSRLVDSVDEKDFSLSEQVECAYRYLDEDLRRGLTSKEYIQFCWSLWFRQAVVLYKIIQPDLIIVWNGLLGKRAIYAEAARFLGIPLFYAEKGMLPDSWYVDPKGPNALSAVAENKVEDEINDDQMLTWASRLAAISREGKSSWEQPQRKDLAELKKNLGVKEKQRIIFFPSQVEADSNIILFSPHFPDSKEALKWLTATLSKEEYFILTKPHPKEKKNVEEIIEIVGDRGKVVSDINVLDAIEMADCVVSINSAVAFEASLRKKPVFLLGESVLSKKDFVFCYDPHKEGCSQIKECMERARAQEDVFYRQALSFADHLDGEYYAYLKRQETVTALLQRSAGTISGTKEKFFSAKELGGICSHIFMDDLRFVPGRTLIRALMDRIKEKFLIRIQRNRKNSKHE